MKRVTGITDTMQLVLGLMSADVSKMATSTEALSPAEGSKLARYLMSLCGAYAVTGQHKEIEAAEWRAIRDGEAE